MEYKLMWFLKKFGMVACKECKSCAFAKNAKAQLLHSE